MNFSLIFLVLLTLTVKFSKSLIQTTELNALENFLNNVNKQLADLYKKEVTANYKLEVFQQQQNIEESINATNSIIEYIRHIQNAIKRFQKIVNLDENESLKRQLSRLPKVGYEILNDSDLVNLENVILELSEIYKNTNLCSYQNPVKCNLTLIPDIQDILHTSNDINEITYYWEAWRNQTGIKFKESFNKFIELYRKTAQLNGFNSASDMWYYNFDQMNVIDELDSIMTTIRPFFLQFHARIRYLLRLKYGSKVIKKSLPYPQQLSEILIGDAYRYENGDTNINFPYPEKPLPNITETLIAQSYTSERIFDVALNFFKSIGMDSISKSFWNTNALPVASIKQNPFDCWNKAWYFYGKTPSDVKLSYCLKIDFQQFLNMHSVLGDVYYYHLFQEQLPIFRDEPLPNFSDAIGKVISMSASTPKYLEKVGLLPQGSYDEEKRVNRLYIQGLQKIFLIPILFMLDKYRIQIFENQIPVWNNCAFWELTQKYTGAIPPINRSQSDFDAPSKLLVGVDDEYSSHVIAVILQFQIYKRLCEEVGEYKKHDKNYPLDNCDLSGYPEVGEKLKKAMSFGASKSWHEILEILTGETNLNALGFLEYFQPLFEWLIQDNNKNHAEIGWQEIKRNQLIL